MPKVLYDITTLGNIHCAPGVTGAGIFRAAESLALALDRRPEIDLHFSSAPGQQRKAIRYLRETGHFRPDQFALPSLSAHDSVARSAALSRLNDVDASPLGKHLLEFADSTYSPERIASSDRFDIYHVGWRGEQELPVSSFSGVVLTIYDVIALKHPEWFVESGAPNPIGDHLRQLLESVRPDHQIIVNANSVKNDILNLFPQIKSEQLHIVPLGVSDRFYRRSSEQIAVTRRRYGVPDGHRYLLCVNTLEPRKNMKKVIEAYCDLVRAGEVDDLSLVLVGAKGWLHGHLEAVVNGVSRLAGASIIFAGFVDDDDIPSLYSGSSLFCYPSLDEGFGLPLLEAMKCGAPVLTSDRPALKDTSGGAAVYVDPTNSDDLGRAIVEVLEHEEVSEDLRRRGEKWVSQFTWDSSAAAVAEVYDTATRSRSNRASQASSGRPTADRWSLLESVHPEADLSPSARLAAMAGAFIGRRAIVMGDSTVQQDVPLGALGGEFTFAVNEFARFYDRIRWKPSFYFALGDSLSDERCMEINSLTGSVLFLDDSEADRLRTAIDVIGVDCRLGSPVLGGMDVPSQLDDVELFGSERAQAAALLTASHLGFDPIYIVGPESDGTWSSPTETPSKPISDAMVRWHHSFRRWTEENGKTVVNLSPRSLLNVYRRGDPYEVLAERPLKEYGREDAAHVDETQVIASMFKDLSQQRRTMIDVGAHRGTSAKFFVNDDWMIHCFEPDPANRLHLERKFGSRENLTIDVRAVGESSEDNVAFFSSEQSSGISGLSAFHGTHRQSGSVDITTVASIVEEYDVEHIDFLKIDVEGFDFGVLKGVPWDRFLPDVIECEFEDAKTVPLGHNWRDIAQFLADRGYAVYVSEWHPIARYGVRHDWRRVVPFPGMDPSENSWGNLLAFQKDPGLAAVQRGFAPLLDFAKSDRAAHTAATNVTVPALKPQQPVAQASTNPETMTKRPSYADTGDRIRKVSPGLHRSLSTARRASASALRRWKVLTVAGVVVLALGLAGILVSGSVPRLAVATAALAIAVLIGFSLLVGRVYAIAQRLERTNKRLQTLSSSQSKDARQSVAANGQSIKTSEQLNDLRRELDWLSDSVAEISELRSRFADLESETVAKSAATAASSAATINDLRTGLTQLETAEAATVARVEETERRLGEWRTAITSVEEEQKQVGVALDLHLDRRSGNSNYVNASAFRMNKRELTREDVAEIRKVWLKQFALDLTDREIYYMAHKLCMDEEACEGRLATSVQAGVMRALALMSVRSREMEILEIGTLCGIGAGSLHRIGKRAQRDVNLTLIDPLMGYYGSSAVDRQTGVAITRATVERNLASLCVPTDDYRIIQHLSTDDEAIKAASDRMYDYLLIDGDHSLTGVSNDYELYSHLVKPGGLLVFDDYDTEDWPAIKPFVDEHVRTDDEWLWLGGRWRTGILQRKFRRRLSGPT